MEYRPEEEEEERSNSESTDTEEEEEELALTNEQKVELQKFKLSLRANKSQLKTEAKCTAELCKMITSGDTIDNLLEQKKKLSSRIEKIQDLTIKVQQLEPQSYDVHKKSCEKYYKKYNETITEIVIAQRRASKQPTLQPPAAEPAGAVHTAPGPNVGSIEVLKPFKLRRDSKTEKLRLWTKRFRQWYGIHNFSKLRVANQQAYFYSCIEENLVARIENNIDESTPIFEAGGCIDILQHEFKKFYPKFNRRIDYYRINQAKGQLMSDFIQQMIQRGEDADIGSMTLEDQHVMRILTGTIDSKLREAYNRLNEPTLQELRKTTEEIESQRLRIRKTERSLETQNNSYANYTENRGRNYDEKFQKNPMEGKCFRCLSDKHISINCPRKDATCEACKKYGHIKRACEMRKKYKKWLDRVKSNNHSRNNSRQRIRSKSNARAAEVSDSEGETSDNEESSGTPAYISMATKESTKICKLGNVKTPKIEVIIKSKGATPFKCKVLPDTGASSTILNAKLCNTYGIKYNTKRRIPIYAANGGKLKNYGEAKITIKFDGKSTQVIALVTPDINLDCLIGWNDLKNMQLIHDEFPYSRICEITQDDPKTNIDDEFNSLLDEYKDVFEPNDSNGKLKTMKMDPVKLQLREQPPSRKVTAARRVPIHMKKACDEALDTAIKNGTLVPQDKAVPMVAPGFFRMKPNGTARIVADFSYLNKYLLTREHPFMAVKEIIENMPTDAKYFCKLDCSNAYHLCPVDKESQDYLTVMLPQGCYKYTRMAMGLRPSSFEWCRSSDRAFAGVPNHLKLVDDILVYGSTRKECLSGVRKYYKRPEKPTL